MVVGDDGNGAPGEGQPHLLAHQFPIAGVFRVHGDGHVAQQGLGAGGGHGQIAVLAGQVIADVPQVAVLFIGNDLQVGDSRLQLRVPIDQALTAIDQPLFVEAHEHLGDGLRQAFVQGEALP